jgi:hypothetical protein
MNEEAMKCGLLMEAAQRHQSLVEAALEAMKTHTAGLDAIVREEIRRTFVDELCMLAAEIQTAIRSLHALRRSANMRLAVWSVTITATCCAMMIAVILSAARWLLPSQAEIAALRSQHEGLASAIARLQEHGGRIDLRRCGDTGRFCVRVDRHAPAFGQGADYFVVAGY